jgi:hypothetical protein
VVSLSRIGGVATAIIFSSESAERFHSGIQCDQIGRIFASWVIVFLGQFFLELRNGPDFWATFFLPQKIASILTKNGPRCI